MARSAEALRVRDAREGEILRKDVEFLEHPIKEIKFQVQSGLARGRQRIGEIDDHGTKPARDLDIRRAVIANLGEGEMDEIIPVRRAENHEEIAGGAEDEVGAEVAAARTAQDAVKLVDGEHRGGWVVDCRG